MTTATAKFEQVALKDLQEAPYNPRRTFDDETLKELAESIRAKGVLTPILVRPVNGHFEIVGGARRFRAARQAGLKEVPCQVRELTDDEALEVAVIDNLQRADVTPIEEARGYQELLRRGHKVEDLAKRIGKSVRYVYARLELGKLSPAAAKALEEGKITASHAQLIATLDKEEDQKKVLEKAYIETYAADVTPEGGVVEPVFDQKGKENGDVRALLSVRDFKEVVTATKLGAEIVDQVNALKIAGHKAAIIGEQDWYSNKTVVARRRWKSQGSKPCKYPAKGVLVDGKTRGKVLDICLTTSCKKHFATHPVGPSGGTSPEEMRRQQEAQQRKAEQEKRKREIEQAVKLEIFRRVRNKVRELPKRALNALLVQQLWCQRDDEALEGIKPGLSKGTRQQRLKVVESLKPIEFAQAAIAALCADDIDSNPWSHVEHHIADYAQDLKVDVKALEKGVRGKFEAEEKAAAEKAKPRIKWNTKAHPVTGKVPGMTHPFTIERNGASFKWTCGADFGKGYETVKDAMAGAEAYVREGDAAQAAAKKKS